MVQGSSRIDREPCPWRLIDDAGGAFSFGLVGGTIWNTFGGFRNAPRGEGFRQAVARVKARAPILGGSFAIWGVLFASFECTILQIRKKEDLWNPILSGAATGGVLAARSGLKNMGKNALVGGVILAAIEGLGVVISRYIVPTMERYQMNAAQPIDMLEPPIDPKRRKPIWQPTLSSPLIIDRSVFQDSIAPVEGHNNSSNTMTITTSADESQKPKSSWSLW